jgi:hypothetical protein
MKRTPLRRRTAIKPRRETPRRGRLHAPELLAWVRSLPCCASSLGDCAGPVVAHHPRHLAGGMGMKADDNVAISLCRRHHQELHEVRGSFAGWARDELRLWQDLALIKRGFPRGKV